MKLAILYFACRRDMQLLQISAGSLSTHGECRHPIIALFDSSEYDAGLSEDLRFAHVRESAFPRGYSLNNSTACIAGMLRAMDSVAEDFGATHILKIDCDTIMTGDLAAAIAPLGDSVIIGQADEVRFDCYGVEAHRYRYVRGHAYILSREIVTTALSLIDEGLWDAVDAYAHGMLSRAPRPGGISWPEDETISLLAQMLAPDRNRWAMHPSDAPVLWCANYDHSTRSAKTATFTNFGDLIGTSKNDTRKFIADAMANHTK